MVWRQCKAPSKASAARHWRLFSQAPSTALQRPTPGRVRSRGMAPSEARADCAGRPSRKCAQRRATDGAGWMRSWGMALVKGRAACRRSPSPHAPTAPLQPTTPGWMQRDGMAPSHFRDNIRRWKRPGRGGSLAGGDSESIKCRALDGVTSAIFHHVLRDSDTEFGLHLRHS